MASGLSVRAELWNGHEVLSPFDLLDLHPTDDDHRFRLEARPTLCTPFGFLYGGSAIAASVEAAERATGRDLQWITTQFIGSPAPGDVIDIEVSMPAHGKATTQSQIEGRIGDRVMFSSLAAHTTRPSGDGAQFASMPEVAPPEDCSPMMRPFESDTSGTFFDTLDRRLAVGSLGQDAIDRPQTDGLALWTRILGDEIGSPATQAYVADIIPLGIGAALGSMPGGTSLDNTLRVIDPVPSEWVLLEIIPDGFHRSIGHGSLRIWSQDGRLMGAAQQTCIIRTSHHR